MRIVGGRWRSRKVDWPSDGNTRPITDRVRESVFDILGAHYGTLGELPPLRVADVFCGGGSLGLEALSRGAARVCFFDSSSLAIAALKSNLAHLEVGPEATVVTTDIWRAAVRVPSGFGPLNLVFLDPPFREARSVSGRSRLGGLLRRLGAGQMIAREVLIVLRHENDVRWPKVMGRYWVPADRREYGRSAISFLRWQSPEDGALSEGEGAGWGEGDDEPELF